MTPADVVSMVRAIAPVIRETIAAAIRPVADRVLALEARAPVAGPPGAPGAKGDPGDPGAPGTLEDLTVTYDGDRTITLARASGAILGAFRLPIPIYRGLFDPARGYELGDLVTFHGSVWAAK